MTMKWTFSSSNTLLTLVGLVNSSIGVLLPIAFIIVIATVVRRHRPDAAPILLGATICECLIAVGSTLALYVLPYFIDVSPPSASGRSSYTDAIALCNLMFGVGRTMARILLLWGIVRLAQPPSRLHE